MKPKLYILIGIIASLGTSYQAFAMQDTENSCHELSKIHMTLNVVKQMIPECVSHYGTPVNGNVCSKIKYLIDLCQATNDGMKCNTGIRAKCIDSCPLLKNEGYEAVKVCKREYGHLNPYNKYCVKPIDFYEHASRCFPTSSKYDLQFIEHWNKICKKTQNGSLCHSPEADLLRERCWYHVDRPDMLRFIYIHGDYHIGSPENIGAFGDMREN